VIQKAVNPMTSKFLNKSFYLKKIKVNLIGEFYFKPLISRLIMHFYKTVKK